MFNKLFFCLSFVGAVSVASAASTGYQSCGTYSSPTELVATFLCPQFSLGGTLTEVDLRASGAIQGTITLISSNVNSAINASATTVSNFSVSNPSSLPGFTFITPLISATFSSGMQTLPIGSTYTSPMLNATGTTVTLQDTGSLGAPYVGNGTFQVGVQTSSTTSGSGGGGNLLVGGNTAATASIAVNYNYSLAGASTVPEPSTTALGATGLLGLMFFARRRVKA